MKSKLKILNSLIIIILAVSLSACGPSAPVEPTIDPNLIKTEAVQTAFAQMTLEAIMNPSATPQPTDTPVPTATTAPTMTVTATAGTPVALPGVATQAVALPGVATKPASGLAPVTTGDKGEWVSNTPEDDFKFYLKTDTGKFRNGGVDLTWVIRNTGTTTWNGTYFARYYSGTKIVSPDSVYLKETSVAPGGVANITVDVICPSTAGTYYTTWVLSNPDGQNFVTFTFQIIVVDGSGPEVRDIN